MPATFLHRAILTFGFISLFHAAYSAAQRKYKYTFWMISLQLNISDRSYLRLNELEFTNLPLDVSHPISRDSLYVCINLQIIIQALLSLFVIMYGVMYIAGDFKEIKASADLQNKSWETFNNIPSFYTFNHRGKVFSPYYIPNNSKSSLDHGDS